MGREHGFSASGYYRIEVQGRLQSSWSDRLGAMRVLSEQSRKGASVTVLQGRVSDQAELSGILNTLYELHLPLLSVRHLGDEPSQESDPNGPPET